MRPFLFAIVLLLLNSGRAALAQDPVQLVLQSAPQALRLAGSAQNLHSLVTGLVQGTPVRLAAAGPKGFDRVITFVPAPLSPAQVVARLEAVARDFELLGIAQPTPEQLGAALAGRVQSALEPDLRQPSPQEQAVAALPAEVRAVVGELPPREALRKVELADQNLIALGVRAPSAAQRAAMVERLSGRGYVEASAGGSSFPPLSPLVAAPLWQP